MRHYGSKQLSKKRKVEAMNGGSESKKVEASNKQADKKDESRDTKTTTSIAAPPKKRQRYGMFSTKKSGGDAEDDDTSEDGGDDKIADGAKKVTKRPGDPFTAVRNNLLAQVTTLSSTQHTVTPTPASKLAKLSSKQTTLTFDISPNIPSQSVESPRKPADFSDRAAAPAKVTNVVPKPITGGVGATQPLENNKVQGSRIRERFLEARRKGAKDANEALAHFQDKNLSTATVIGDGNSSTTSKSIFGTAVRAENEIMEGIEERDARQEMLKSESIEAMGFDDIPVASASQESAMAVAAAALKVSQAVAGAQASDSEDTIIVRPEVLATPTVKDESAPKGTVARRSGATNPAKSNNKNAKPLSTQSGGPKKRNTPDTKPGSGVIKREYSNEKPSTPVSKVGSHVVSKSGGGNGTEIESPARLRKNADRSLARKPKAAGTSATKESASPKQEKPIPAATHAKSTATPAAASVATQAKPGASRATAAVKIAAPANNGATITPQGAPQAIMQIVQQSPAPTAAPTSTDAVKIARPANNGATIAPQGAPQAIMQSISQSPAPANTNQILIFVINVESPTNPENSTQLYHPFALTTPFPLFSATVAGELGPDEQLVFASAGKGQVSYPGMATARFPVAMPTVGMIWASIMKKLAGVVGSGGETGEVVTVTFS